MKAMDKKASFRTATGAASILLILASILSCQSSKEPPTEGSSATESQTADPVTEECEYHAPESDYGGADFSILITDTRNNGAVWKCMNYCEMFSEDSGDVLNTAIYQRNLTVSELFHLNFQEYPVNTLNDTGTVFQNTVLAGDDLFGFAMVNGNSLKGLLATNAMYDLRYIEAIDLSHSWWNQEMLDSFTLFGHTYAATGDISLYTQFSPQCVYFNQNMITNNDMEDPYTLVKNGNWTIDKLNQMCRTISADLNGDDIRDLEDQYGLSCEPGTLRSLSLGAGNRFTDKNADGVVVNTVDVGRMASVIETAVPLLTDKQVSLLSTNYMNYSNPFMDVLLPMFTDNHALFFINQIFMSLDMRNMKADFGLIPLPKLDTAQKEYYTSLSSTWSTYTVIPTTAKEPEMSGAVIEAMGYYGQQLLIPAFYEMTLKEKVARDADSVKMLDIIYDNLVFDLAGFNQWEIEGLLQNLVWWNSVDFSSKYAGIEQAMNTAITNTLELWEAAAE